MSQFSQDYRERMLPGYVSEFAQTDPEFTRLFDDFVFDQVINQDELPVRTRFLAILAALLGCQGEEEFRRMLPAALNVGVTPVEVKETVYQAAAYLAQVDIFGEQMRDFYRSGPEESRHIRYFLAANCFGDYYTRRGMDYRQREMITFCFLAALGGCEPQLVSHAKANLRIGNDKRFLIQVLTQCLPYIGYPRALNALRCVEEAAE